MMFEVFFKGVGLGIVLSLAAGPVFFNLLNTSIHKGFTAGAFMAFGITISDILYILLAYLGLSQIIDEDNSVGSYLGYAGGMILFVFGFFYIFRKVKISKQPIQVRSGSILVKETLKGFLINGVNPFVFIFWMGMMTFATIENDFSRYQLLLFFSGVIFTVFSTDLLKAFLADKIRRYLTTKVMGVMYKIMGLALIGFGIRMIYYGLTH